MTVNTEPKKVDEKGEGQTRREFVDRLAKTAKVAVPVAVVASLNLPKAKAY